jgi:D-sedoheptulose 7-phosphate isomerase
MTDKGNETAQYIVGEIEASIAAKQEVINQQVSLITKIAETIISSLRSGNKLIVFGNGGSAADAQHIAAELVNRFRRERRALAALALTTDTSNLTSIGNDYSFDNIFSRQIEALGKRGDVALAISTSGNSPNVLNGVGQAKELGITTVGATGEDGGKLKDHVDICFQAPSRSTPRIQEVHITVAHVICDLIEKAFCDQDG